MQRPEPRYARKRDINRVKKEMDFNWNTMLLIKSQIETECYQKFFNLGNTIAALNKKIIEIEKRINIEKKVNQFDSNTYLK